MDRNFSKITEDELGELAKNSKRMAIECFHDVVWHHSYVVIDPDGVVHTFCIYSAPDEARLRAHAAAFGGHHRRMEALQGVSDILGIGLVGAGRRTHEVHEEDRDEHALLPGAFGASSPAPHVGQNAASGGGSRPQSGHAGMGELRCGEAGRGRS
ncbi:MAG: nickel-binding protein [Actinomycetota bacterium]